MRGSLFLLCVLGVALALSAAGHERVAPAPPGGQTDPKELVELAIEREPLVARRVAKLRDHRFDQIPTPEVLTGEELGELEASKGGSGNDPDLAADEAVVRILGLLTPHEQLEDAVGATADLAAAAYDPETDRLYVISDAVGAEPALVEFLLAHELTHAIEDQVFGLADLTAVSDDDSALAQLALSEGTATALMVDYGSRYLNPFELTAAGASIDASTGAVPKFIVEQLEWAYTGGMDFVNGLRAVTDDWKLVDHALGSRPPRSTEQILHPLSYLRDERPVEVEVRSDALEGDGWKRATAGVAGEFSTRQLLELGVEPTQAARAAAGWNGDRYELWQRETDPAECHNSCRGDLVLALRWKLASAADAAELHRSLGVYLREGLGGSAAGSVIELGAGSAATARAGSEVALVFAPDAALARGVADEQV